MITLNPFLISGILITIIYLPLSIFVYKNAHSTLGRVFSAHLFVIFLWGIGSIILASNTNPLYTDIAFRVSYSPVLFISVTFYHAIYLFTKSKNRIILYFSYLQAIFFAICLFTGIMATKIEPMFHDIYIKVPTNNFLFSAIFWCIIVTLAHIELVRYYKICHPKERKQIFIINFASIGFLGGGTNYLAALGFNVYPIGNLFIPLHSLAVMYAIFKHQFLDIQFVIKKGIVYSLLLAFIFSIYFVLAVFFERTLQSFLGYQSIYISILTAFTLGLAFIPLRNKINYFVERLFFKKSHQETLEENRLLQEELTRSEKLKSVATLASGVAHEIKNPLTAIKTFTEYLPEKYQDAQFVNKFSKIVGKEVLRIDKLVHKLLDFAKPSPLEIENTSIHDLIEDTLDFLNSDFLKHNIKVQKRYIAEPEIKLKIDAKQMTQALLNIYLNAIDSMPNGGVLTVITNTKDNKYQIVINDTGRGIPQENISNIFDPFYTSKDSGTGLGLSVTHGIIKEHNGTIRVDSKESQGARFIIELPLQ